MVIPATSLRPPRVSIVVAAYNREREIGEALDTMLAQTFEDLEIIVVDDGSHDRTGEIVQGYGDRVRYLRQENGGVGAARNTGILHARGEYLAYCDADDIQFPFRIAAQVALLDAAPEACAVFTDCTELRGTRTTQTSTLRARWLGPTPRRFEADLAYHFPRGGRPVGSLVGSLVPAEYAERRVYEGWIHGWLSSVHAAWGGTLLARTDAVRAVGGHWEAIRTYEDYALASELSKRWPLVYLDVPTFSYRIHPEQLTGRQRLNSECYRDAVLHVWRSDPRFYPQHKATIDMAMGTAYAVMGEVEARDGNWAAAEENFRRAILEWSGVGRRPYANLVLTAIKHRVPLSRTGLLDKLIPGFLPMAANTGVAVPE